MKFSETLTDLTIGIFASNLSSIIIVLTAANQRQNLRLAAGALLGQALTETTIGFAILLFITGGIDMQNVGFKKNLLFFLLSISYLLFLIYIGDITLVYSLLYFTIYIVYGGIVVFTDHRERLRMT
jgi:Ca2+/Na+ antiporter